jgi:nuclear autoantigenic sperm protein
MDVAAMTVEADESYSKGVAAIKAGAMEDAIELLARALELKTAIHGDQAIETAAAYYKYGCALFYKAQDENTVFGKQAQARADAKADADRRAGAADADADADDGEACDDDEGEDAAKDAEDEDEEEDDMELAWKLVENARLIYEEDENHPIELANCFETLGEMNTEHANFQSALEDLEQCLAILETELDEDDRRIAGVLLSISVAQQMDDKLEKALTNCSRAVGICEARIKRLKSSDEAAVEAVNASLPPGVPPHDDPLAAAKAELEQIEAVLGDLKVREEELQGLVGEDNDTREQIKKAFAAVGGVGGGSGHPNAGSSAGGVVETTGFDAPKLAPGTAQPVNLGVVGKSAGGATRVTPAATGVEVKKPPTRITAAPVSAPPAPAGSSAAAAAAAFASMASEPAAKKAKIAPMPVAPAPGAEAGQGQEKENAPGGECAQQ